MMDPSSKYWFSRCFLWLAFFIWCRRINNKGAKMRKARELVFIIIFFLVMIVLLGDIISSNIKKKNVETFLKSRITNCRIIEPEKSFLVQNNDILYCFLNLFANSEMTEKDLYRGELTNICKIELINEENTVYNEMIVYSDSTEVYRVIFFGSNNFQYNFIKNEYFYEFIRLYKSYQREI